MLCGQEVRLMELNMACLVCLRISKHARLHDACRFADKGLKENKNATFVYEVGAADIAHLLVV